MIYEMVDVRVAPKDVDAFTDAVASVAHLFREAAGGHGLQVLHSSEQPGRFRLIVGWDRLEDHVEVFRGSAAFETWRCTVGRFYISPPDVEHFTALSGCRPDFPA